MNKQNSSTNPTINFSEEDWSNHPIIEWMSAYKKIIIGFLAFLLLLLVIAVRFLSEKNANAEKDFLKAEQLFSRFQQDEMTNGDEAKKVLQQLEGIMVKYPDLQAKYDGGIAQSLLIEGNPEQAAFYETRVFNRTTSEQLALYKEFSQISLLIGKENFPEALQKSLQLNQMLESGSNQSTSPILYLYNSIRIAILFQQLKNLDEEKQAWAHVQNLLNRRGKFGQLNTVLQSGKLSFKQFIDEKIKN